MTDEGIDDMWAALVVYACGSIIGGVLGMLAYVLA